MFCTNRRIRGFLFFCAMAAFYAAGAAAQTVPADLQAAIDRAVEMVKPALVRIEVVSAAYSEGREVKFQSSGSGAIITPEGHVVTNHHVAGRATRLVCTLSSKEEIEAELVGTDALTDIAVIKLKNPEGRQFPVATWGDSSKVKVGDHVLAMGSPMALSQSVTLGIVSNTEMMTPRFFGPDAQFKLDGEDVGSIVKWIGHDADIYGGNSGGPLVNLEGQIIGINEIRMALAGAIPGNLAKRMVEELIAHGRVKRSWLGVTIQPLLKNAENERGVILGSPMKGSPAEKAGFQAGDILVKLNGEDIVVKFQEQIPAFNSYVSELPIGGTYEAVVLRDGREVTLQVTTAEREEALPDEHELKQWGMTARDISFVIAREMKRDTQEGVLVTTVRPGGPVGVAKPNIQAQDVIIEVDGKPVKNVEELKAVTAALTEGKDAPVPTLVTFERKTGKFITVVEVGIRELDDPGREVAKAWLPVETQVITRDIAKHLGQENLKGFRVTRVYPGTSAEAAGLQQGDFILAVDEMPLEAAAPEDYEELPALIRQYKIGTQATLDILRNGERMRVPVELIASPKLSREMKKYRDANFEFTVRDVTFQDKADEKWAEDQTGVLVEEIQRGGWAAIGFLSVGDLILAVNGKPVQNVDEMQAEMEAIAGAKPKWVVLKVLRGIHTTFVELEPKWEENS